MSLPHIPGTHYPLIYLMFLRNFVATFIIFYLPFHLSFFFYRTISFILRKSILSVFVTYILSDFMIAHCRCSKTLSRNQDSRNLKYLNPQLMYSLQNFQELYHQSNYYTTCSVKC